MSYKNIKILGHRGVGATSGASPFKGKILPENTLESFEKALDMGADGLEFDICLSKDGIPVIIHPAMINCNPSNYTLDELKAMRIEDKYEIPTLDETLQFIHDYEKKTARKIILNPEFKGDNIENESIVNASYSIISKFLNTCKLLPDQFIFNTTDWSKLSELKLMDNRMPVIPVALTNLLFAKVGENYQVDPEEPIREELFNDFIQFNEETGAYAIDVVAKDVRPELIQFCIVQNIGLIVTPGYDCINNRALHDQFSLMLQAQNYLPFVSIRTDDIEELTKYLEELDDGQQPGLSSQAQYDGTRLFEYSPK